MKMENKKNEGYCDFHLSIIICVSLKYSSYNKTDGYENISDWVVYSWIVLKGFVLKTLLKGIVDNGFLNGVALLSNSVDLILLV